MKIFIFVIGLMAFSLSANAEVISLTCESPSEPYNLTIATPPSVKSSIVLWNDKPTENFGRFQSWLDGISIGASEIVFYHYLKDVDTGKVTRIHYKISRVSGVLNTTFSENGKVIWDASDTRKCEPRRANKF